MPLLAADFSLTYLCWKRRKAWFAARIQTGAHFPPSSLPRLTRPTVAPGPAQIQAQAYFRREIIYFTYIHPIDLAYISMQYTLVHPSCAESTVNLPVDYLSEKPPSSKIFIVASRFEGWRRAVDWMCVEACKTSDWTCQ